MTTREQEQADRQIREIEWLHRNRGLLWVAFFSIGAVSLYLLIEGVAWLAHWLGGAL